MAAAYKPGEEASEQNLPCQHLNLGVPTSKTVRNKFPLFKSPCLRTLPSKLTQNIKRKSRKCQILTKMKNLNDCRTA